MLRHDGISWRHQKFISALTRVSLNAQKDFLRQQNRPKTSKIVGAISVSKEYKIMSKILGQDVSIRSLFLL